MIHLCRFHYNKCTVPVEYIGNKSHCMCQGQGCMGSLYLLFNFTVNLKLFYKIQSTTFRALLPQWKVYGSGGVRSVEIPLSKVKYQQLHLVSPIIKRGTMPSELLCVFRDKLFLIWVCYWAHFLSDPKSSSLSVGIGLGSAPGPGCCASCPATWAIWSSKSNGAWNISGR